MGAAKPIRIFNFKLPLAQPMSNFIHNLHIENFKSIKSLDLKCKRINVFVGKPNVGKSNILEAVGLYGAGYERLTAKTEETLLSRHIRFEKYSDIFNEYSKATPVVVKSEIGTAALVYDPNSFGYNLLYNKSPEIVETFLEDLRVGRTNYHDFKNFFHYRENVGNGGFFISNIAAGDEDWYITWTPFDKPSNVMKYNYKGQIKSKHRDYPTALIPPYGDNIADVVGNRIELLRELGELFEPYGQQLVYDRGGELIVQLKSPSTNTVIQHSIYQSADTLQRLIFYLTAIRTNQNSILVLEEPEVHSFPPYIREIAEEIVESTTNQFFIATHSPYLLNTLIQDTKYEEMAFFVTWYEDYETKVRELTEEEVAQISDWGVDIFFNLDAYLHK